MSYIRPAPLPTHYAELDAVKRYRLSDPKPKQDVPGSILLVVAAAFVAGCLATILWGRV